jgi:hypothetical protein
MMMPAAGRLAAMVSAGAGIGRAGLRPRPRSRFHPPASDTPLALTGWDDLSGDGSPDPLADDGNGLDGEVGALTAGDRGPRSADAGQLSGRSPRRTNRSGRAASGASGNHPSARRATATGPGPDSTGDPEPQLSQAHPGAGGQRARRQLDLGFGNLVYEPISTAGGLEDRSGRRTRGTRVDDMPQEEHPVPRTMIGTDPRATDPGAADHHAGPDAPLLRTTWPALYPGRPDQAMGAGFTEPGGDVAEGADWQDGTPPAGALRPRITGTAASGVRRRPADGAATVGSGGARGEREVTVQVSIGRIEVRMAPAPPATRGGRPAASRPAIRPGLVTLEEYGARREDRR